MLSIVALQHVRMTQASCIDLQARQLVRECHLKRIYYQAMDRIREGVEDCCLGPHVPIGFGENSFTQRV